MRRLSDALSWLGVDGSFLRWFFTATEEELREFLARDLELAGYEVVYEEGYLYASGEEPVCLVAHTDTATSVRYFVGRKVYLDEEEGVLWSPHGLGADDRAGVLGILWLLNRGLRPSVLFPTGEEHGGVGASQAAEALREEAGRFRCIIELDRRGNLEAVFYRCGNEEFRRWVESFGFTTRQGSFSDISFLCPRWDVAGVNLSAGFQDEHTGLEHLYLGALRETLVRVEQMIKEVPEERFPFEGIEQPSWSVSGDGNSSSWSGGGKVLPFPEQDLYLTANGLFYSLQSQEPCLLLRGNAVSFIPKAATFHRVVVVREGGYVY